MQMTVIASDWVALYSISLLALIGVLIVMLYIYSSSITDELREVKKWQQTLIAKIDASDAFHRHYEEQVQPLVDLLNRVDNPGVFYDPTQLVPIEPLHNTKTWLYQNEDNIKTEKRAAITKKLEDQ